MQNASKLLNQLTEKGVDSKEQLNGKILGLYDDQIDVTDEIKSAERELTSLEQEIRILKDYHALLPIYKESSALNGRKRERFDESHKSELIRYNTVKKAANLFCGRTGSYRTFKRFKSAITS